jgi:dTDP-4-dehydrorhamnose reductase
MRVLIFGKTGQVGRELARVCWPEHWQIAQLGRADCDLIDSRAIMAAIENAQPEIVINAAAYTAVDRAEAEPQLAQMVNGDAPASMAAACSRIDAKLIHLSTDYVFDGLKADPYCEDDRVNPLSVYGRSKEEGESAIRGMLSQHVIIRTSWVFAAEGTNFVRTMLRLAKERSELRIVRDQRGAPTAAQDIAAAIFSIVRHAAEGRGVFGTFHFTSGEATTWFDFAKAIFDVWGQGPRLLPIATADYPTAARRPLNSVLDCRRISHEYGIEQPNWRLALQQILAETKRLSKSPELIFP